MDDFDEREAVLPLYPTLLMLPEEIDGSELFLTFLSKLNSVKLYLYIFMFGLY